MLSYSVTLLPGAVTLALARRHVDTKKQRRDDMGATILARVRTGVLEPLEKTDLPEGTEVLITVVSVAEDHDDEAFVRSAGSWEGLIDAEKFIQQVYEDRLFNSRANPKA